MTDWRNSKYLAFAWSGLSASGLTERWAVTSMSSGDRLGGVAWYGPWRQYTFDPERGTLFNSGCLAEIAAFLVEMTEAQRKRRSAPVEAEEVTHDQS